MSLLQSTFTHQSVDRYAPPQAAVRTYSPEHMDSYQDAGAARLPRATTDLVRGPSQCHLPDTMVAALRPHVIRLSRGRFSDEGCMQTNAAAVNAMFEEHLVRALADAQARGEKLRILFYAHGRLSSEQGVLHQAYHHIHWWKKNQIYPIYFIWPELQETFWQRLQGKTGWMGRAVAGQPLFDTAVEELVRATGGRAVWQSIKENARMASEPQGGGAYYVAQKLEAFCKAHANAVELHAIGHSAGAIFHSHFIPTVLGTARVPFRTVQFLAPALTVEAFGRELRAEMGQGLDHLTIFTLCQALEQSDPVAAPFYNRSILSLVSNVLEAERQKPLLGLEVSLRGDAELKRLFGLDGSSAPYGEVIWAQTARSQGRSASHARRHVDFHRDRPTMNSLLRRVLGATDHQPIHPYPQQPARSPRRWPRIATVPRPRIYQFSMHNLRP